MKKLITLIILLIPVSLFAAETTIEITGPDEVQAGHPAWYKITNVPQTKVGLMIWPNEEIDVRPDHVAKNTIFFWAEKTGTYKIYIGVVDFANEATYPLQKTISVIGTNPDDDGDDNDDGGDDNKPPKPDKLNWQVKLFTDKDLEDNLTMDQVALLNGLKFRDDLKERGDLFLGQYNITADVVRSWPLKQYKKGCETGKCYFTVEHAPPEELGQEWWDHVRGKEMPRIAFAPIEGGQIQDFPLPANEDEAFKLIEGLKDE